MFLTRGQPVVYSGDEQGFTGPGGDKDARQDMFASKVADYLDDDLIGTDRTHAERRSTTRRTRSTGPSPTLGRAARRPTRRCATASRSPGTRPTAPGVFAFSRIDPTDRTEYVVAVNNADTAQTVTVDTWSAGATFTGIYGGVGATADGRRATAS